MFSRKSTKTQNREKVCGIYATPHFLLSPASASFSTIWLHLGLLSPQLPNKGSCILFHWESETASITHPLQIQSEEAKYLVNETKKLGSSFFHVGPTQVLLRFRRLGILGLLQGKVNSDSMLELLPQLAFSCLCYYNHTWWLPRILPLCLTVKLKWLCRILSTCRWQKEINTSPAWALPF